MATIFDSNIRFGLFTERTRLNRTISA
jgi:hypothetical protein